MSFETQTVDRTSDDACGVVDRTSDDTCGVVDRTSDDAGGLPRSVSAPKHNTLANHTGNQRDTRRCILKSKRDAEGFAAARRYA